LNPDFIGNWRDSFLLPMFVKLSEVHIFLSVLSILLSVMKAKIHPQYLYRHQAEEVLDVS